MKEWTDAAVEGWIEKREGSRKGKAKKHHAPRVKKPGDRVFVGERCVSPIRSVFLKLARRGVQPTKESILEELRQQLKQNMNHRRREKILEIFRLAGEEVSVYDFLGPIE